MLKTLFRAKVTINHDTSLKESTRNFGFVDLRVTESNFPGIRRGMYLTDIFLMELDSRETSTQNLLYDFDQFGLHRPTIKELLQLFVVGEPSLIGWLNTYGVCVGLTKPWHDFKGDGFVPLLSHCQQPKHYLELQSVFTTWKNLLVLGIKSRYQLS